MCGALVLASPEAHAQAPGPRPAPAPAATQAPVPSATTAPSATPAPATTPAATAAPDAQADAADRKHAGDEAMEAFRYADALAAYGDAYAINKDPALLYNMGRALQALNRFPEALDKLAAFEAAASPELKARVPRLAALIAEIKARVATLTIRTNVPGARILVRDTVVGKSPLTAPVKLVAGAADVEIEAEGYYPGKKKVELPGGGELTVELELFSRSTTGILAVKASAAGAEVLVDGKRVGVAPVELHIVKGTHQVVVKHPDFRLYETTTVVPAGGTQTVTAALQSSSVVTRWWFWSAVGAVVTAGVVWGVAAVTERAPDAGTIAPGQLDTKGLGAGTALWRF